MKTIKINESTHYFLIYTQARIGKEALPTLDITIKYLFDFWNSNYKKDEKHEK